MPGNSLYMLMRFTASSFSDAFNAFYVSSKGARSHALTCPNILECPQSHFSLSQTSLLEFLPPIFSTRSPRLLRARARGIILLPADVTQ